MRGILILIRMLDMELLSLSEKLEKKILMEESQSMILVLETEKLLRDQLSN